jgi:hypothetical protein
MSLNRSFITGLFYLIPGNVEMFYCEKFLSSVNLQADSYSTIINKRNFLYICGAFSIFLAFTPFKILRYFAYCLCIYSIYEYFSSITLFMM